ncbi:MAG: gephyrin-like molybdotransferase Glp [Bacillota bacterium]|jgi:molybdopterin molybdotransferase|nr:molybdopterin molybdenumtransferase MoeA [Bacillota bacterium]
MSLFLSLVPSDEAWARLCSYLEEGPHGSETVRLTEAIGRRLAHDVHSPVDLPGFIRSTMDGFAVRAADTFGASDALPALLSLAGEVPMGRAAEGTLPRHSCMRVATGAMLPEGADAVVMMEHTEMVDDATVAVLRPVAPGENVVAPDEDVASGGLLLPKGRLLREHDIAALGAVGMCEVEVSARPRVGIISTGDELVDVGEQPAPGQVRDMNSYSLYAAAKAAGARPKLYGIVRDNFEILLAALRGALAESDMLIVSGGSSIGSRDYTREAIEALGEPGVLVHGIAVKPGKPTIIAVAGGKPVFGLPGHPASCLNIFRLLVEPAIARWMGWSGPVGRRVNARIAANVASAAGREDFVAVKIVERDGQLWAEPLFSKSALISGLVSADGVARIPSESEGVLKGDTVTVHLWR